MEIETFPFGTKALPIGKFMFPMGTAALPMDMEGFPIGKNEIPVGNNSWPKRQFKEFQTNFPVPRKVSVERKIA